MLLAQQLATAFADGDWETARRISPLPAWNDETYEEGFAGLEASTVFLGGSDTSDPSRFVMYLAQVAHESREEGPQTSIYCVRWDLLPDSSTIDKVAGEVLLREPGFTPPGDAERGAWQCDRFDQEPDPAPVATPAPPDAPSPGPAPPNDEVDLPLGWRLLDRLGTTYVCRPSIDFESAHGDLDCQRFTGAIPGYSLPELRCSPDGISFTCTDENYYPSELDNFEIAQIDGTRALCKRSDCWTWNSWESPGSATTGLPDYKCSDNRCTRR